jgi:dipeptidyl aminopeptidase/acylaminoacyl peptidase
MNPWASFGRSVVCVVLFTMFSTLSRADQPLTPAQVLDYSRAGDLHFSPDGTKLAYVVYTYRQDWSPHLWLMDVATGASRDLTPAKKSERLPQWSPDGSMLAFLSNRGGKAQVYIVAAGANAVALTAQKNGVKSFHWSPNGKTIACLAQEDGAQDGDSGPQVADREGDLPRLWLIDLASKQTRKLGVTGYQIDEFQWRDGAHLLIAATDRPRVEEDTDAIYSVAIADGAVTLVSRPPQPLAGLIVSPDGAQYGLRSTQANGPDPRDLFVGAGNDLKDISASIGFATADVRWTDPSAIWVRAVDGFHTRLYRIAPDAAPVRIDLPLSVEAFDVSHDGTVAFVGGDFAHPSQIYLREKDGRIRETAALQQSLDAARLAPVTLFHTRSFDGTDIESALMTPKARREKMPLVLLVHGGPSSNFSAGYSWEIAWGQMLASRGYEVLMVNPRGSNGYSEGFLKANKSDWGGGDYKDLMAVLDAVIAKGHTDPARLGIGGWSYGGEMSEWAITQSDRFKAAVVGAGVYDQAAEFETEDGPQGDEWYFGTPWEHPDVFARNSPSSTIANAHTPTLIFDGEDDTDNPVGQSKGLYRALKHLGVETTMVLYPGEGHSPKLLANNLDMFTRILDWYDGHLKKK